MVYRVDKKLVVFTTLLFITSLFFTFSVYSSDFGNGGLVVCFVIVAFILFNLVVLISKKIEVTDGDICQSTVYGSKCININDLEEIGVIKLRWRVILILSDPHKFVFISSLYEEFDVFVQYLKDHSPEPIEGMINPVTPKLLKKKQVFLFTVIVGMTAFFIGSGVYNLLYR
jgi:hypothetical protein